MMLVSLQLPVLEAVCHQLPFGQVVEPGELPAAVSAGVESCEALIASFQLHREKEREKVTVRRIRAAGGSNCGPGFSHEVINCLTASHLRGKGKGAGLLERPRAGAQHLDAEVH